MDHMLERIASLSAGASKDGRGTRTILLGEKDDEVKGAGIVSDRRTFDEY